MGELQTAHHTTSHCYEKPVRKYRSGWRHLQSKGRTGAGCFPPLMYLISSLGQSGHQLFQPRGGSAITTPIPGQTLTRQHWGDLQASREAE